MPDSVSVSDGSFPAPSASTTSTSTSVRSSLSFQSHFPSPSLSSDPFLSHLHTRLTSAERSYLLSDFSTALSSALDILHELVTLTSSFSSPSPLLPPAHSCSSDCVCQAAFVLALQAAVATGARWEAVAALVDEWYGAVERAPYGVVVVALMAGMGERRYAEVMRAAVAWLERRKKAAGGGGGGGERATDAEYGAVLELLVFHALVPQGEFSEAALLVRKSERLDKERKAAWVAAIRRMQDAAEAREERKDANADTVARAAKDGRAAEAEEKRSDELSAPQQPAASALVDAGAGGKRWEGIGGRLHVGGRSSGAFVVAVAAFVAVNLPRITAWPRVSRVACTIAASGRGVSAGHRFTHASLPRAASRFHARPAISLACYRGAAVADTIGLAAAHFVVELDGG